MHSILIVRTSKKDMNETKKTWQNHHPTQAWADGEYIQATLGEDMESPWPWNCGRPFSQAYHTLLILKSFFLGGEPPCKGNNQQTKYSHLLTSAQQYMVFHNMPIYALYNHLFHGVNHYLPQSNQQRWCFMIKTPTKCGKVLKCVRPLKSLVLKKGLSFPVTP